jgi:hypothetical protein
MNKFVTQFFQGEEGTSSMPRLLAFMAFFPATYALICIRTSEALGVYLTAYVAQYGAGRYFSTKGKLGHVVKPTRK